MLVSLNWLKEYVDIDEKVFDIKDICEMLTMSGSKVEKYTKFGEKVEGVVTALVEKVERHPLDNKLKKVTLTDGENSYVVVANIDDIEEGNVVPFAKIGAKINDKVIEKVEIKSIESFGMICHISDLGLSKELYPTVNLSGLIVMPKNVGLGKDINDVLGLGDYIIEFEITPNRPDCLSVEGLARETAATFDKEYNIELFQDKEFEPNKVSTLNNNIKLNVVSKECNKYILSYASDIKIDETPFEIYIKLLKCGIIPTNNNIIDISNFVMLEIGQPMHAFDANKVGNNIIVRNGNENEKIITLDGEERVLNNNDIVIADDENALAVAGVMGGLNSSITSDTKEVLFEFANFVRGNVRNTAKKFNLRTEASSRFEKGLPYYLVYPALNRVCNLINKYNFGNMNLDVIDIDNDFYMPSRILMDYEKINSVIGTKIETSVVNAILNKLDIKVELGIASAPYYRTDINIIEDLAEEVARFFGYTRIDSTMPITNMTYGYKTPMQKFEDGLTNFMISKGFNEIYTYTFFSKETLNKVYEDADMDNLIKIKNPLSIDFEYMRTTTIPHMLEALERNYSRKNDSSKLFEIGKVFLKENMLDKKDLPHEKNILTIGIYDKNCDFFTLKNIVCDIIKKNKIDVDIRRSLDVALHPGISADIMVENNVLASIGKISPRIIENYNLPEDTFIAIIDLENVFNNRKKEFKYKELPKYPAVERDISFVLSKDILSSDIIKSIKTSSEFVENVILFDVYEGEQIESNMKSMAYKIILRDINKTLDENDINVIMDKILVTLRKDFNAEIRK